MMRLLATSCALLFALQAFSQQELIFDPKNIGSFGLKNSFQISLTYDDGPNGTINSGVTKEILDVLKVYNDNGFNIVATFFMLGKKAEKKPELVKRAMDEGHIVANHTFDHPSLTRSEFDQRNNLLLQLKKTHKILSPFMPKKSNPDKRWYFRAPYGAWKANRAEVANSDSELKNYIGPIFWSVGGELNIKNGEVVSAADWNCWSKKITPKNCAYGYLNKLKEKKGGVILFHDVNIKTVELTKYFLVSITRVNLFHDEKYESLIHKFNMASYDFISLDDISELTFWDRRFF